MSNYCLGKNPKKYKHYTGSGPFSLDDIKKGMKYIPIVGPLLDKAMNMSDEAKKRMEGKAKKPTIVPVKEE